MAATAASPVLVEGQDLEIELDACDVRVTATVLAFAGPAIVLRLRGELDRYFGFAISRRAVGDLVVQQGDGRSWALRGEVSAGERDDEATVVLLSDPRAAQSRVHTRAPLELPARLTPVGPAGQVLGRAVETVTADVSCGGAALVRPPGTLPAPRWAIELDLPQADGVLLGATLVRQTPERLMVRFADVPPEAAKALLLAVVGWNRVLLR